MTCACNPSTLKDCLEREDGQDYTLGRKEETDQMKEKRKERKKNNHILNRSESYRASLFDREQGLTEGRGEKIQRSFKSADLSMWAMIPFEAAYQISYRSDIYDS